ncbi:MAG: WhiB family transcriptional regulator [Ferrimicrobium sp.]
MGGNMTGENWRDRAACRGWGLNLFFPPDDPRGESPGERRLRENQAKRVCRGCPVQQDCLNWALTKGESRGIWGGRNELERKAMMRARRHIRVVV